MTTFEYAVIIGLLAVIAMLVFGLFLGLRLMRNPWWERYRYYYRGPYDRYHGDWLDFLDRVIRDSERRMGTQISWGAREMLLVPIVESYNRRGPIPPEVIEESVRLVLSASAEDGRSKEHLDSIDVIRGFHKRFCNIPPFCDRTEDR
jgi:hypothetical protein